MVSSSGTYRFQIIAEATDAASRVLGGVLGSLQRIGEFTLGNLAANGIQTITERVAGLGAAAIQGAADMQRMEVALVGLLARELANGGQGSQNRLDWGTEEEQKLADLRLKAAQDKAQIDEMFQQIWERENVWEQPPVLDLKTRHADLDLAKSKYDQLLKDIAEMETLQKRAAAQNAIPLQLREISDVLPEAEAKSKKLMDQLSRIAILSPYTVENTQQTFKMAMAFGYTSAEAVKFTQAILNVSAGIGADNSMLDRMAYNLGQIRLQGKVTALDFRQLAMAGFDLNAVLQYTGRTLGVQINSYEDFNKAIADGTITWEQFTDMFAQYAEKNFGGASERMSRTMIGLQSTWSDVWTLTMPQLLGPSLQHVIDLANDVLNAFLGLRDSGVLSELGKDLGDKVGAGITRVRSLLNQAVPMFDAFFGTLLRGNGILAAVSAVLQRLVPQKTFMDIARVLSAIQNFADRFGAHLSAGNFAGVAQDIGDVIGGIADNIATTLKNNWPTISKQLKKWAEDFWNWVTGEGGVIPTAAANLGAIATNVAAWATNAWKEISPSLAAWGTGFWEWVTKTVIPAATANLASITTTIATWATNAWTTSVAPTLSTWGTTFWNWITTTVIPAAQANLGAITTYISTWMTTTWNTVLYPKLSGWAQQFWDWAGQAALSASGKLEALTAQFKTWCEDPNTVKQLEGGAVAFIGAIWKAISDAAGSAEAAATDSDSIITQIATKLENSVKNVESGLKTMGSQIAQDIYNGIVEKLASIDWAGILKDVATKILEGGNFGDRVQKDFQGKVNTAMAQEDRLTRARRPGTSEWLDYEAGMWLKQRTGDLSKWTEQYAKDHPIPKEAYAGWPSFGNPLEWLGGQLTGNDFLNRFRLPWQWESQAAPGGSAIYDPNKVNGKSWMDLLLGDAGGGGFGLAGWILQNFVGEGLGTASGASGELQAPVTELGTKFPGWLATGLAQQRELLTQSAITATQEAVKSASKYAVIEFRYVFPKVEGNPWGDNDTSGTGNNTNPRGPQPKPKGPQAADYNPNQPKGPKQKADTLNIYLDRRALDQAPGTQSALRQLGRELRA